MPYGFRPEVYPQSPLTIFLIMHIAGAIVAALAGPLQFWGKFRRERMNTHRVLGRCYLVGVSVGAVSALVIAPIAQGGLTTQVGFSILGVLWFCSTAIAFYKILKKDWLAHQQWMIRSYGLTLAFVTLRIWLGGLALTGAPFDEVYQTVAWLCWIPNILIVEMYLGLQKNAPALSEMRTPRSATALVRN
jgi:uncharacterized membrane protein